MPSHITLTYNGLIAEDARALYGTRRLPSMETSAGRLGLYHDSCATCKYLGTTRFQCCGYTIQTSGGQIQCVLDSGDVSRETACLIGVQRISKAETSLLNVIALGTDIYRSVDGSPKLCLREIVQEFSQYPISKA